MGLGLRLSDDGRRLGLGLSLRDRFGPCGYGSEASDEQFFGGGHAVVWLEAFVVSEAVHHFRVECDNFSAVVGEFSGVLCEFFTGFFYLRGELCVVRRWCGLGGASPWRATGVSICSLRIR